MSNSIKENEDDDIEANDDFNSQDPVEESTTADTTTADSKTKSVITASTINPSQGNNTQQQQEEQEAKPVSDSKFFAIRTTGGQEHVVANILQSKVNTKKIDIRSILV